MTIPKSCAAIFDKAEGEIKDSLASNRSGCDGVISLEKMKSGIRTLAELISGGIALNTATSIKIADANPDRTFFNVNTDGDNQAVWIKLQAAEVDNDKKGIWIEAKIGALNSWQMPTDAIYTGEICAISNSGTPKVFVTEY